MLRFIQDSIENLLCKNEYRPFQQLPLQLSDLNMLSELGHTEFAFDMNTVNHNVRM